MKYIKTRDVKDPTIAKQYSKEELLKFKAELFEINKDLFEDQEFLEKFIEDILKINYRSTDSIHGYVYLTFFDNKPMYVGQTTVLTYRHSTSYHGSGKIITRALKKYDSNRFFTVVLQNAETQAELDMLEKYYIKRYNTLVPRGWNISIGGNGGASLSFFGQSNPCSKTNMSEAKRKEKARKGLETKKKRIKEGKIYKHGGYAKGSEEASNLAKLSWQRCRENGTAKIRIQNAIETKRKSGILYDVAKHASLIAAEKRKLYGHPTDKIWIITEPNGKTHTIRGGLNKFCKTFNLSIRFMRSNLNKGKILALPKRVYSDKTKNCLNWEIKGGQHDIPNIKI